MRSSFKIVTLISTCAAALHIKGQSNTTEEKNTTADSDNLNSYQKQLVEAARSGNLQEFTHLWLPSTRLLRENCAYDVVLATVQNFTPSTKAIVSMLSHAFSLPHFSVAQFHDLASNGKITESYFDALACACKMTEDQLNAQAVHFTIEDQSFEGADDEAKRKQLDKKYAYVMSLLWNKFDIDLKQAHQEYPQVKQIGSETKILQQRSKFFFTKLFDISWLEGFGEKFLPETAAFFKDKLKESIRIAIHSNDLKYLKFCQARLAPACALFGASCRGMRNYSDQMFLHHYAASQEEIEPAAPAEGEDVDAAETHSDTVPSSAHPGLPENILHQIFDRLEQEGLESWMK